MCQFHRTGHLNIRSLSAFAYRWWHPFICESAFLCFMCKKRTLFLFLNVCVPLLIGLGVYLLFYTDTNINCFVNGVLGISVPHICFDGFGYRILTCWACDVLWAYSLVFALFACLRVYKRPLVLCGIVASVFAVAIELLQRLSFVTGTFDVLDIVFEILAILFALVIVKRRWFDA